MASFNRVDYHVMYEFARQQYFWHESTGRGFDVQAALIMSKCEDVIGQMSNFPIYAREILEKTPKKILDKLWKELSDATP